MQNLQRIFDFRRKFCIETTKSRILCKICIFKGCRYSSDEFCGFEIGLKSSTDIGWASKREKPPCKKEGFVNCLNSMFNQKLSGAVGRFWRFFASSSMPASRRRHILRSCTGSSGEPWALCLALFCLVYCFPGLVMIPAWASLPEYGALYSNNWFTI